MYIDLRWKTMSTLGTEISHTLVQQCVIRLPMLVGSRSSICGIVFETNKLRQLFNKIFEKFLKAIDHMEFHPTLGKEKKGTSYRLHKRSAKDREASMIHQLKYLSP